MNYKHLHYFWTVLRTGSIARASEQLHLTPQTLSGQIKQLEERLGKPLLRKAGRGLEATEAGTAQGLAPRAAPAPFADVLRGGNWRADAEAFAARAEELFLSCRTELQD